MSFHSARKLTLQMLTIGIASNFAWAEPPKGIVLKGSNSLIVSGKESDVTKPPRGIQLVGSKSHIVTAKEFDETEPPSMMEVAGDVETIRERFKSGKVRIEKNVVLDKDGNFVNHGMFTEWNEKGELVQTGTYKNGERDGAWIKIFTSAQSKLFENSASNKFKSPFQTTVDFSNGEMNGIWTITDASDNLVCHISLDKGLRNGRSIWSIPSSNSVCEADYENGVLNGQYIEREAGGKLIKQLDYSSGCVRQVVRETFPNKQPKSEVNVLSSKAKLVSKDSFETLTFASYVPDGEPVRDGQFVHYHSNGTIRTKGMFKLGEVTGNFEVWHANGERECVGTFQNGKQVGKWTWWHDNGMRKSSGQYENDLLQGEMLAWDTNGKRVKATTTDSPAKIAKQDSESLVDSAIKQPEPMPQPAKAALRALPASAVIGDGGRR